MNGMSFANPEYFFLLIFIPVMIFWYWRREKRRLTDIKVSSTGVFRTTPRSLRLRLRHLVFLLRILALILIVTALARPRSTSRGETVNTEGIDIVLTTDISGSMLAEDFHPNRIEAAKKVATDFIENRPSDRIGLVIFSAESFTQCPLTLDHDVVINLLKEVKSGMIDDGTAIGSGLATAISRLKESKAKSRIIILLTDGVNNMGSIDPMTAAGIAQTFGIRVYTIGVGTVGTAPYPVQTPFGVQYQNMPVEIDEALLQKIADLTGGKYFRATNNQTLKEIYTEIDRLEKSKIEVMQFRRYKEDFYTAGMMAGVLLLLEVIFGQTIFRKIP